MVAGLCVLQCSGVRSCRNRDIKVGGDLEGLAAWQVDQSVAGTWKGSARRKGPFAAECFKTNFRRKDVVDS